MKIQSSLLLLPLLLAPLSGSQEISAFKLRIQDGKVLEGRVVGLGAKGLSLGLSAGKRVLEFSELLDLQGPARLHEGSKLPMLRLHSGMSIRASILGGDEDGDNLQLRGPILGSKTLSLDEVAEIRIPQGGALVDERQLQVAEEDRDKERIFRNAPMGLDMVKGFLFRISDKGVHFAPWHDEDKPKLYPWAEISALTLPSPEEKAKTVEGPELVILTRDGSLWRGRPLGLTKGAWRLQTSIGEMSISAGAIVAAHVEDKVSRTWLSELRPEKVTEYGLVKGEAHWKVLFSYRRRLSNLGGPLRVGGAIWTQGLGAHSYSRLEFKVPPGRTRFLTQVGIDDSALLVDPSGNAAFRIYLDGKKVGEIPSLKGGQDVRSFPVLRVLPGQILALEIDFADHLFTGDRGDWLGAVFLP